MSRRTLLRAVSCLTGQFGISPDRRQGADVWLQNHLRGPGKNPAVCMVLPEGRWLCLLSVGAAVGAPVAVAAVLASERGVCGRPKDPENALLCFG